MKHIETEHLFIFVIQEIVKDFIIAIKWQNNKLNHDKNILKLTVISLMFTCFCPFSW